MSNSSTPRPATSLLPKLWEVPQAFRERLGNCVGRQRVMWAEGHLLLVLHAAPHPDDDARAGCFFWRNPSGEWRSTEQGPGLESLKSHLERYSARVNEIDEQEEHATNSEDYFDVRNQLTPVQRAARNMYDVLSEARKVCSDDRGLIDVRDSAYALARRIELLHEHTKTSMDYEVARRAEQQANASHQMAIAAHRLNLLAAFFFPLATISSILGMNVATGVEDWKFPYGMLVVLGVGALAGLCLTQFLSRPQHPE